MQGAMNRLESFSAVLILEEYETSMLLMQELFGWSKTGSGVEVNVSPGGRSNSGEGGKQKFLRVSTCRRPWPILCGLSSKRISHY